MTISVIKNPFEYFSDTDGNALDGGKIYIGVSGLDPITNPKASYFDAAGSIPAAMPIRTTAGYPTNAGAAAQVYTDGNYSIRVLDENDSLVFSDEAVTDGSVEGLIFDTKQALLADTTLDYNNTIAGTYLDTRDGLSFVVLVPGASGAPGASTTDGGLVLADVYKGAGDPEGVSAPATISNDGTRIYSSGGAVHPKLFGMVSLGAGASAAEIDAAALRNDQAHLDMMSAIKTSQVLDPDNFPLNGFEILYPAGNIHFSEEPWVDANWVRVRGASVATTQLCQLGAGYALRVGSTVADTVGGEIPAEYQLAQGQSIGHMSMFCEDDAGLGGLKFHASQFGVGGIQQVMLRNCPIGLDLNDVWNGFPVRDIGYFDRSGRDGQKYGIYCRDNTNNIQFADINIQKMSEGTSMATGMRLEQPDNVSLKNIVFKGGWSFLDLLQDPTSPTAHRDGGGLGIHLDGIYLEPNDAAGAEANAPDEWWIVRARSASEDDPIRNIIIENMKAGFGHVNTGTLNMFKLRNVMDMRVSNCVLKGLVGSGTVNHVEAEGTNTNVVFEDTNTFNPDTTAGPDASATDPKLTISGSREGIVTGRPEYQVNISEFIGATPIEIDVSGTPVAVIEMPDVGRTDILAQVGFPAHFNTSARTLVEIQYATATVAAGQVARLTVEVKGVSIGASLGSTTASNTSDTPPSEAAYELSRQCKAQWEIPAGNHRQAMIKISRVPAFAADTLTESLYVVGVRMFQVFDKYTTESTSVMW